MDKGHTAQVLGVLAMGCIVLAIGAWALALVGAAPWRRWLGTVTSSCVLAAMVFAGVSILMAISPEQAAEWDHWLRGGERPLTGPAFWCVVLALGGVGVAIGASLAAIYSPSGWIRRFQMLAHYARLTAFGFALASVVLWN
ncbi:hypothetical protein [Herpetosiphon giganteus]|uniref:hypothetical protein n=1 Tax=Herpetosiphon giganteus TaxID=2029754 RepID=UPI00195A0F95|nr:hypothetical protein [Herpetosiphon giganteus]MBM7845583.1 hypothetical protein [Herpetosiphon giganteus]